MLKKIRHISRLFLYAAMVVYPILVFYFMVIRRVPTRVFSLFLIAFALFAFILGTSKKKQKRPAAFFAAPILLFGIGALCLVFDSGIFLKFYPLLMNLVFLFAFGFTLVHPPSMIFRFALIQDRSIPGSLGEESITLYCKKVTLVWMGFFIFNGGIALWSILNGSELIWAVYNGGVSYILMGSLFIGEFLIRRRVQKKVPKAVPLSAFKEKSRDPSMVMCYEGVFSEGKYKTWSDFLEGTSRLRRHIEKLPSHSCLLYSEDCWYFLLAFTALLQCRKEILLSPGLSPAYLAEIRGDAAILTDQVFEGNAYPGDSLYIPDLKELLRLP